MPKFKLAIVLFLFIVVPIFSIYAREHNILLYGAVGDGKTLNTESIQAAIDEAFKEGGGKVVVPKGRFLSGSIVLKSGVELYLEKKGVLLGSTNPEHYLKINRWKALIMADSASNISISGKGVIDGQGEQLALTVDSLFYAGKIDSANYNFKDKRPKVYVRPQNIEMVNCKQVLVTGVTIKNSASWVQSYYRCTDLVIDKITVDSDTYWNNDGVDIIDCKNVKITNSYVNSSDDGICLKSYARPWHGSPQCENIIISNCTVRSSASAVKFGTASFGGFKKVIIEKIKVFDTFRSAIAIESYGNGVLEDVIVQHVKAKNTGNAIFIRIGRERSEIPPGILKNVIIEDVKVEVPFKRPDYKYEIRGPELPFFHNVFPSSITGIPGHYVENVKLKNIKIVYPGRGNQAFASLPLDRIDEIPEQIDHYPEFSMFGELPAWGFYIRHVQGLSMEDIQLKVKKSDYRRAFVLDDVKNSTFNSIDVVGDNKESSFFLKRVENVKVEGVNRSSNP